MISKIKSIKAREILDSRGNPTVKAIVETKNGFFSACVPSGASRGSYEALELRDGGKRFLGKGVLKAVKNIEEIIAPRLKSEKILPQKKIDKILIDLDGTSDKSRLGANAILAVSIACLKAGARASNEPLYKYITQIYQEGIHLKSQSKTNFRNSFPFPKACFNILNGGVHAGNDLDIQEFMIIPQFGLFKENLRAASEVYHTLKGILAQRVGKSAINVGDEGGFAPPFHKTKEALNFIMTAIQLAGYQGKIKIGLDCAASEFFKGKYYQFEGKERSGEELLEFYQTLTKNYPILFLEDPFSQDDWANFRRITTFFKNELKVDFSALPQNNNVSQNQREILVIGDDLLATNPERIKEAQAKKACSGMIIKPNQIGTVTETFKAVRLAKNFGWKTIVSHRSGETCDDFIADFAVGVESEFIKSGAPARGERVSKYNRLLEIEEALNLKI